MVTHLGTLSAAAVCVFGWGRYLELEKVVFCLDCHFRPWPNLLSQRPSFHSLREKQPQLLCAAGGAGYHGLEVPTQGPTEPVCLLSSSSLIV